MMIAGLFIKTSLPISNRPSMPRQQHGNTTPTVLLMVLAVVALLAIGYLMVQLFSTPPTVEHSQQGPVFSSKPIATSATNAAITAETTDAGELANKATDTDTGANTDDSNLVSLTNSSIPDPKAIINAKIPESESLAKEEIDRLEDERKRLVEQEKLAKEQLQLVADINQRKAAQIALLEQQIAELEKDKATAKP
jgi:hypothetical protein